MYYDKAMVGDTSVYVYGSPNDLEYAKSYYASLDEEKEVVADEYPSYVRKNDKRVRKTHRVQEDLGTPKVFVYSGSSSWIDSHPSRRKIIAWTCVAIAIALVIVGMLFASFVLSRAAASQ